MVIPISKNHPAMNNKMFDIDFFHYCNKKRYLLEPIVRDRNCNATCILNNLSVCYEKGGMFLKSILSNNFEVKIKAIFVNIVMRK